MAEYFDPLNINNISDCIINSLKNKNKYKIDKNKLYIYNWNRCIEEYIKIIDHI